MTSALIFEKAKRVFPTVCEHLGFKCPYCQETFRCNSSMNARSVMDDSWNDCYCIKCNVYAEVKSKCTNSTTLCKDDIYKMGLDGGSYKEFTEKTNKPLLIVVFYNMTVSENLHSTGSASLYDLHITVSDIDYCRKTDYVVERDTKFTSYAKYQIYFLCKIHNLC